MKRLALGISLSLLLLSNFQTQAQDAQRSRDDSSAVRATVRDYIEAYYTGDARRMQRTLHPHYLKHKIHGNIPMREMSRAQMLHLARLGPPTISPAERTEQVSVPDVAGDIASAQLVTPGWVDYLTLSKVDGEWKILPVVQRIDN